MPSFSEERAGLVVSLFDKLVDPELAMDEVVNVGSVLIGVLSRDEEVNSWKLLA
jgi:hypothetical protein